MKPTFSIIVFTTLSGCGFGVLAWLFVLTACGVLPAARGFGAAAVLVALGLAALGLSSSAFHLGHPERAWRALSQWRTSWLSREGIVSLLAFPPAVIAGVAWWITGQPSVVVVVAGLIAAVLALATIGCTAMIYASLKPIRQWHNQLVLPVYLLNALAGGGAWLAAVAAFWSSARAAAALAILAALAALTLKLAYWRYIDTTPGRSTAETATGLGAIGKVRMLAPPHTEENYLLREMGFAVGRKHVRVLRGISVAAAYGVPAVLLLAAVSVGAGGAAIGLAACAALLAAAGLLVERWLFFAEATHTVTLYYGRAA
jgi:DMSO reductase anchor subunit